MTTFVLIFSKTIGYRLKLKFWDPKLKKKNVLKHY